jgi:hypothetical protein
MDKITIDGRLEVGAFVITYGRDAEGLYVVSMTPGRLVTFGGRRVQSKRSTETVLTELKAWEKIGRFNEIAKALGQDQALALGAALDDVISE